MALSVLDGNQSATTLSSVVTGGEHIVAHSVVSLGSNAISNITTAISGSTVCVGNLGLLQSTVATEGLSASGSFIKIGGHTGTSTTGNIVHVSAVGALRVDGSVYTQPVSIASVTIGNTVTIAGTVSMASQVYGESTNKYAIRSAVAFIDGGDLLDVTDTNPLPISGTVTANPTGTQTIAGSVTLGAGTAQIGSVTASISNLDQISTDLGNNAPPLGVQLGFLASEENYQMVNPSYPLPISGTVTIGSALPAGTNRIGVVTIGAGTVTIGAGTAQIGSVTASISNSVTIASFATSVTARLINPAGTAVTYAEVGTAGNPSIDVLSVQGVSGGTSLLIGGTTGSFTTRFGSVTTANTAQISTAVTNLSRKYLFVQNVTTSSNVITVGIGFTPTTTQGIQLAAGALIDFESSFIPTGAVYILSSVTGSPFTILEA
jgi:trimeric autotransporter adhesin